MIPQSSSRNGLHKSAEINFEIWDTSASGNERVNSPLGTVCRHVYMQLFFIQLLMSPKLDTEFLRAVHRVLGPQPHLAIYHKTSSNVAWCACWEILLFLLTTIVSYHFKCFNSFVFATQSPCLLTRSCDWGGWSGAYGCRKLVWSGCSVCLE